jgi:hypothetical protein
MSQLPPCALRGRGSISGGRIELDNDPSWLPGGQAREGRGRRWSRVSCQGHTAEYRQHQRRRPPPCRGVRIVVFHNPFLSSTGKGMKRSDRMLPLYARAPPVVAGGDVGFRGVCCRRPSHQRATRFWNALTGPDVSLHRDVKRLSHNTFTILSHLSPRTVNACKTRLIYLHVPPGDEWHWNEDRLDQGLFKEEPCHCEHSLHLLL